MAQLCLDCCVTGPKYGATAARDPNRLGLCFKHVMVTTTTFAPSGDGPPFVVAAKPCEILHDLTVSGAPPLYPFHLDHAPVFANDEGEFRTTLPFDTASIERASTILSLRVTWTTARMCHCCADQVQQACWDVRKANIAPMAVGSVRRAHNIALTSADLYFMNHSDLVYHPRVARVLRLCARLADKGPLSGLEARHFNMATAYLRLYMSSQAIDDNVLRWL